MKALEIILTQNCANYKREEIFNSKMTYPLPPFSTVIGALHSACEYKEYHPMKIGIQGQFGSIYKKIYTNHCYLDKCENTRGHLVLASNPNLVAGNPHIVASSLASQGNDFKKGISIKVEDEKSLEYYRELLDFNNNFKKRQQEELKPIQEEYAKLNDVIKTTIDKVEKDNLQAQKKIVGDQKKQKEEELKLYKKEMYTDEYAYFKTLVTSAQYYEVLSDIKLVLHICSDEKTMNDIFNNIFNIRSLGRHEDVVHIEDINFVELDNSFDVDDENLEYRNDLQMYIDYALIRDGVVKPRFSEGVYTNGTRYFLNKDYKIVNGQRIFNKKHVVYTSGYEVNGNAENLCISNSGYLVNLI